MVEIKKMAFADRDAYSGDPRHVRFEAERLFDGPFVCGAPPRDTVEGERPDDAGALAVLATDTTYMAIVDRDGNAVSLIESVFQRVRRGVHGPGHGHHAQRPPHRLLSRCGLANALAPGKAPDPHAQHR